MKLSEILSSIERKEITQLTVDANYLLYEFLAHQPNFDRFCKSILNSYIEKISVQHSSISFKSSYSNILPSLFANIALSSSIKEVSIVGIYQDKGNLIYVDMLKRLLDSILSIQTLERFSFTNSYLASFGSKVFIELGRSISSHPNLKSCNFEGNRIYSFEVYVLTDFIRLCVNNAGLEVLSLIGFLDGYNLISSDDSSEHSLILMRIWQTMFMSSKRFPDSMTCFEAGVLYTARYTPRELTPSSECFTLICEQIESGFNDLPKLDLVVSYMVRFKAITVDGALQILLKRVQSSSQLPFYAQYPIKEASRSQIEAIFIAGIEQQENDIHGVHVDFLALMRPDLRGTLLSMRLKHLKVGHWVNVESYQPLSYRDLVIIREQAPYLGHLLDDALGKIQSIKEEQVKFLDTRITDCSKHPGCVLHLSQYHLTFSELIEALQKHPEFLNMDGSLIVEAGNDRFSKKERMDIAKSMMSTLRGMRLRQEMLDRFEFDEAEQMEIILFAMKESVFLVEDVLVEKIPREQRVQLYILSILESWEEIFSILAYKLKGGGVTPADEVLKIMTAALEEIDDDENNEDLEELGAFVKSKMLVDLDETLIAVFSMDDEQTHILSGPIEHLKSYEFEDDYDVEKFLKVSMWCCFVGFRLLYEAPIENVKGSFNDNRNNMEQLMQGMVSLAAPQLRFTLSTYIVNLFSNPKAYKLFVEITETANKRSFIPSLILASTLLEDEAVVEKTDVVAAKDILASMPGNFNDGVHFRTLIYGMQSICGSTQLNLNDKINLLHMLFKYEIKIARFSNNVDAVAYQREWEQENNDEPSKLLLLQVYSSDTFKFVGVNDGKVFPAKLSGP